MRSGSSSERRSARNSGEVSSQVATGPAQEATRRKTPLIHFGTFPTHQHRRSYDHEAPKMRSPSGIDAHVGRPLHKKASVAIGAEPKSRCRRRMRPSSGSASPQVCLILRGSPWQGQARWPCPASNSLTTVERLQRRPAATPPRPSDAQAPRLRVSVYVAVSFAATAAGDTPSSTAA